MWKINISTGSSVKIKLRELTGENSVKGTERNVSLGIIGGEDKKVKGVPLETGGTVSVYHWECWTIHWFNEHFRHGLLIQQLGKQASNLQHPFWKENITHWTYYSVLFPFINCKWCVIPYFRNKLLPLSAIWKLVAQGTSWKLYFWGRLLRKHYCTSRKTFIVIMVPEGQLCIDVHECMFL